MMYIEAPAPFHGRMQRPIIFMAGGITGCPDWQQEYRRYLEQVPSFEGTILNPRRADFPKTIIDDSITQEQIAWEYMGFQIADIITFWFAEEQVQPIALFELGKHLHRNIVVGCHAEYPRIQDVLIQLKLALPRFRIQTCFEPFMSAVADTAAWWNSPMRFR